MTKIRRTLNYRRCQFADNGPAPTLESYLRRAIQSLPLVENRSFQLSAKTFESNEWDSHKQDGIYLHLNGYTPDATTALTSKNKNVALSEMDTDQAKDGFDFVEGDMNLRVRGNHLVFCSTHIHESYITRYLRTLFKEGLEDHDRACSLQLDKIAKVEQIRMIKEQGVKEIIINASIYEASMREIENADTRIGFFKALIETNQNLQDCQEEESISASITLKKGRKRDMEITQRRLQQIAEDILDEDEDGGWTIVTLNNQIIRSGEIIVRDFFNFEPYGNTILFREAKAALNTFLNELDAAGVLDNN
ncbi:hypothetical protein [Desulfovibrio sp. Fe33]|uniref:hypothetical protein n=1 Tax=Desulfovibrio sp. Fe33 TaxID=3020842 RepID=UPI00234D9045|nr:hypothetical protein [Desulfovibrio sp. Fe33]